LAVVLFLVSSCKIAVAVTTYLDEFVHDIRNFVGQFVDRDRLRDFLVIHYPHLESRFRKVLAEAMGCLPGNNTNCSR
jgi:hypothetical protein